MSVWPLPRAYHIRCVTNLGIPGWVPTEATQPGCNPSHQVWTVGTSGKGNTLLYQRVFPLDPYVHVQAGVVYAMVHLGGKDGLG